MLILKVEGDQQGAGGHSRNLQLISEAARTGSVFTARASRASLQSYRRPAAFPPPTVSFSLLLLLPPWRRPCVEALQRVVGGDERIGVSFHSELIVSVNSPCFISKDTMGWSVAPRASGENCTLVWRFPPNPPPAPSSCLRPVMI